MNNGNCSTRPVLILGAVTRIAVPLARLLQRRCHIPVDVLALHPADARLRSRAIRKFIAMPCAPSSAAEFSEKLLALVAENQYAMLIPVQDLALQVLSHSYALLTGVTHVACPPPAVVERVLDKRLTLQAAEQCGLRVPRSYCVSTAQDLPASLDFPLVLKPAETKNSGGLKAACFQSRAELLHWLTQNGSGKQFLVQEYCPGEGVGIELLIHRGECIAHFQHRRLKEQPPDGGVAVMAIAEKTDPYLLDASVRLLRALEWEGVAMVEFRRNPKDRTAALMEVNGRYWGTTALPLLAGVEFPVYQWQILHGEQCNRSTEIAVGRQWRWTAGYLERLGDLLTRPTGITETSLWKELARVPLDLRPSVRDAVWSFSDPLPFLQEVAGALRLLTQRIASALAHNLLPKRMHTAILEYRSFGPAERRVYRRLRLRMGSRSGKRTPRGARSLVFVCHGNIMRSAFCEALLKRELKSAGYKDIQVVSAGLYAQPGKPADPRAVVVANEFDISLQEHRAQTLTADMVRNADAIFAMDLKNEVKILTHYPAAEKKLFMMIAFAGDQPPATEIRDPYFGDLEETRRCFKLLSTCVQNLAKTIAPGIQAQAHEVPGIGNAARDCIVTGHSGRP